MYNERQDNFSVKDVILQILFVILFVFILMWLFPSKQFVKDSLQPLYDRIFSENILIMKDAAKGYYTTPRLPQNVGDKVSMTLGEMLDKKLLIEFTDSKGKKCDHDESYVEITKYDEEFVMKVNLKCSEQENYILVYMGCYDYCKTTICEKDEADVKTPVIRPSNPVVKGTVNNPSNPGNPGNPGQPTPTPDPGNPTPTPDPGNPTPTPDPGKEYICEYLKVTDGSYGPWGSWSSWSKNSVTANDLRQVDTKTETEVTTANKLVGYNNITKKDPNKPIYGKRQVKVGTKQVTSCASYGYTYQPTGEYRYGDWVYQGIVKVYSIPANSATVKYENIHSSQENCGDCGGEKYWTAEKYTRTSYPVANKVYGCTQYKTETVDVYGTIDVVVDYETTVVREPVYKQVKVETKVKYYRYRTRELKSGSKDYKWSNCNDTNLFELGYNLTGNKKEK